MMDTEYHEKQGVLRGVAKLLNTGGSSVVKAYDTTTEGLNRLMESLQKVPELTDRTIESVTKKTESVKSGKKSRIEKDIREHEKQIKIRYYQIGKASSETMDSEDAGAAEAIKKFHLNVKEHEEEIRKLKESLDQINEVEQQRSLRKKEQKKAEKTEKLRKKGRPAKNIDTLVEESINKIMTEGKFNTPEEKNRFYKVAVELLDSEVEIKCIAAAELGRMTNADAVPVLIEAAGYNNPALISEIVNALILSGDKRALEYFKSGVESHNYIERICCLNGLYKMEEDENLKKALMRALEDKHPEVRRASLTFMGWKGYRDAVPDIEKSLQDRVHRVRKSAVSALASLRDKSSVPELINMLSDKETAIREKALDAIRDITGQSIEFNLMQKGGKLMDAVVRLKELLTPTDDQKREGASPSHVEKETENSGEAEAEKGSEIPYTEKELKTINKAELITICEKLGINPGKSSKDELIRLILEKQE